MAEMKISNYHRLESAELRRTLVGARSRQDWWERRQPAGAAAGVDTRPPSYGANSEMGAPE